MSLVNMGLLVQYPVLILPYMAMLDEAEQAMLLAAVNEWCDINRKRVGTWLLEYSMAVEEQPVCGGSFLGDADEDNPIIRSVGKGRVCLWPREVGRDYLKTHSVEIYSPYSILVKTSRRTCPGYALKTMWSYNLTFLKMK